MCLELIVGTMTAVPVVPALVEAVADSLEVEVAQTADCTAREGLQVVAAVTEAQRTMAWAEVYLEKMMLVAE